MGSVLGIKYKASKCLGSLFGIGLVFPAPGTFGSFIGACFSWYLISFKTNNLKFVAFPSIIFAVSLISIFAGNIISDKGDNDPGWFILDEFVGMMLLIFSFIIIGINEISIKLIITSFVIFRILDIFKPWPINHIEKRTTKGFGILIDDIVAAIIAILPSYLIYSLF